MRIISKYTVILIFLFGISLAQNSEQIDQENKKLSEIHAQIEQLEKEIANLNWNEKSIDKELNKIEEQIFLLGKVVRKYKNRIINERKNIDSLNFMISENIGYQKKLKNELQKYLVFRYKQREVTWLDFLFDSKTFSETYENQFWDEYLLRKINQKIENLKNLEKELSTNRENLLESENKLKLALIEAKKNENLVFGKQQDKLSALSKIRKNKKGISNKVNQKRKDEEKIAKLIKLKGKNI
jgi:septal ring factor EnvC (AmiA/AmiB activator)